MPGKRAPRRVIDPRLRLPALPRDALVFTFRQTQEGTGNVDAVDYFANECFVVTHGVASFPHAEVASKLACDTAIWGYKQERQRKLYWKDKRLIPGRIFQITNLTLWNKQRETGFEEGVYATMALAIIGIHTAWVASLGDMGLFLLRDKKLIRLVRQVRDSKGTVIRVLGESREKIVPNEAHVSFRPQDLLFITTSSVTDAVPLPDICFILQQTRDTPGHLIGAADAILAKAGRGAHTLCMLKRIALPR